MSGERRPQPQNHHREVPTFDPGPSARFAKRALTGARAKGALIGKLAMWAWFEDPAEHEFTKDLDLAVSPEDAVKLRRWLGSRRGAQVRELSIGGVAVREEPVRLDFIDRSNREWGNLSPLYVEALEEALESKRTARVGGVILPLVSCEHLIAMKIATGERKDERDVERLLRAAPFDVERARRIVSTHLGPAVASRLEVLLREAGHPAARRRGPYVEE